MFDGHIHMMADTNKKQFKDRLDLSGISHGIVLSLPPSTFTSEYEFTMQERLDKLLEITEDYSCLFPFFWIDPLEKDAIHQVEESVCAGVKGFKIICIDDYPKNPEAIRVYKRIAHHNKPILFHSGILWNNKNSSEFNRPANFECMLLVEGIRFALAHVSWPWVDECLAVFGKFLKTKNMGMNQQMYIDLTPGTPEIYRKETLYKLFKIGYDVEDRVFWGTDNMTNDYDVNWVNKWWKIDQEIFDELELSQVQINKITHSNLLTFIG